MRYLFRIDTFLVTLSVVGVVGLLLHNPLNSHFFNPVKISLSDFSINDLAFSKVHEKFVKDDRVLIVNIDTAGRKTIGDILVKLSKEQPKLIGLDVLFGPQSDPGDEYLAKTLASIPNLVLSYRTARDPSAGMDTPVFNRLYAPGARSGFVNFVGEDLGVIRYYKPFIKQHGQIWQSFSSAIMASADSAAYASLADRDHAIEWINYRRNSQGYYIISGSDLLRDKVEPNFIASKIVLVGYTNGDPMNIADKHFTPLNDKLLGRSIPDMNGVIIHANILSMIMDHEYITRCPDWLNITIAVLIVWLHLGFLLKYYFRTHLWFHLAAKTVELLLGAILLYLSIKLLEFFDISVDFTFALVAIVIAVDVMYFYEAFTHWLEKKFSIKSIFNQHPIS